MSYLVLSCSLNPASRSRVLARRAAELIELRGEAVAYADLRDYALPMCNAGDCYEHPDVQRLAGLIREARGVLLATPVYNYAASASAKNLIELTGSAWTNQLVGFLCAAGGRSSYMAVMALANSLMLDFRSIVLPRFVFTDEADFNGDAFADENIDNRLGDLAQTLVTLGTAIGAAKERK